ncbi:MAG: response regulator, partial [Chloroflexota bacterium]
MGKGNILFIDNDPLFLETRSMFLERAGYTVYQANTLSEAAKMLNEHWIQLIISDVRANDDDDIHDKTGIDFIQRPEYLKIPKIILTGMPNSKDTRDMLLPQVERDNQPIALNYIDKADGTDEMILVVDTIFDSHIAMNRQLEINWSDINLLELLGKIEEKFNPEELHERLVELDGLLRTLLKGYVKATISQILVDGKQTPRLVAYVWTNQGTNKKYFIEIGKTQRIDNIHQRYMSAKALTRFENSQNFTQLSLCETTARYGAIAWSFRGFGQNQFLATFDQAVQNCDESELVELMSDLQRHTVGPWQGVNTDQSNMKIQHLFNVVRPPQQLFELIYKKAELIAEYSIKVG